MAALLILAPRSPVRQNHARLLDVAPLDAARLAVPLLDAGQRPNLRAPTQTVLRVAMRAASTPKLKAMMLDSTSAKELLLKSSQTMFDSGRPLMRRVLPDDLNAVQQWEHYPEKDVVNGALKSRYFYHCHPPEERDEGEHGHFHLFVDRAAMPAATAPLTSGFPTDVDLPQVVHIASLSIAPSGLPTGWFTTNRWVTDEWLYPAGAIATILPEVDFRGENGDGEVNDWLTAMVALYLPTIINLLNARDALLKSLDVTGDDRSLEITSSACIDLAQLFADQ